MARGSSPSFVTDYEDIVANADSHRILRATLEEVANPSAGQTSAIATDRATENAVEPPVNVDAGTTQVDGHGMDFGSSDATPAPPFRLEASSSRNIYIKTSENLILPFSWWLGQINVEQVIKSLEHSPNAARIDRGYGIGLAVALPWRFVLRCELLLYFWRKAAEPSLSFSLDSHLSFPRVVSWGTESVRSVMCGDVDAMKIEFGLKEATPFDLMPDGSTLLHVSVLRFSLASSGTGLIFLI